MRKIVQISLWVISLVAAYFIYKSVTGPIEFEKEKQKRFAATIAKLKDIRDAQDAYFVVKGTYAPNYQDLVNFVDNGNFTITTQRDTSWTEYDKHYRIDVMKQGVVVDTLGTVPVKDSLFKGSERYKEMMYVPFAKDKNTTFVMKTDVIEKNNYKSPVYEVKIDKKTVLNGLDEDEIAKELGKTGVNDVKGEYISVGSLTEVSNNGNWPTIYDAKLNKSNKK